MKKTIMETRMLTGRVVVLQNDKALFSKVFVGNIYPNGNGAELVSQLSQIYSDRHFKKYIEKFSRREYGYLGSDEFFSIHSTKDFTDKGVIDFRTLKYETTFFADWIYIKNLGCDPVKMIFRNNDSIHLEYRETIATCTGSSIPYPQKERIKTKDTIHSIVLIEKIN